MAAGSASRAADAVRFEALLSPQGQDLLARAAALTAAGSAPLALAAALRRDFPAGLVAQACAQQELRRSARAKFSRAAEMYFTRDGLEQASPEAVASHRAHRFASAGPIADLCCGIGGDLLALAEAHDVLAVDRDPLHLAMATANSAVCGAGRTSRPDGGAGLAGWAGGAVTTVLDDVRDVSLRGVDAVFIDPARRHGTRRLPTGASEPPLAWCFALTAQVGQVAVKAAPGLAHQSVPDGWEAEFVAVGRDLKEAVLWSPALAQTGSRATILPGGDTLTRCAGEPVDVRAPGEYLLDPNPSVTRAGAVEELARTVGAWKIDDHIAFLSADTPVRTPFARTLRVVASVPWRHRDLRATLRALGIGAVEIRRRGLAGDVDDMRRLLKLSGPGRATLVMTRAAGAPWALVCTDITAPGGLTPRGGRPAQPAGQ